MIHRPFTILEPFSDALNVIIFRAEDYPISDEDVMQSLHATDVMRTIQVHENTNIVARELATDKPNADGTMTDKKRLAITTYWADCQNMIVYAPKQNVVGVIHAGWKGLLAGVIPQHFKKLQQEWGIQPKDTYVCNGPSLCHACSEFSDPASELPDVDPAFFKGRLVNLRGIADAQLDEIGVPHRQQERMKDCTKCMSDTYWSYRMNETNKRNLLACCLV